MKRFFQTIVNMFKIEDLRKRLIYTFLLIVVYRLGSPDRGCRRMRF